MSNPNLLIAQLQRRNRIMISSTFGGLAIITIGLGFFMVNTATETPPANPPGTKESLPSETALIDRNSSYTAATNTLPDNTVSIVQEASPKDRQAFLSAVQNFNTDIKAKVTAFPNLAASTAYLDMVGQLEADLVNMTGQNRFKDATNTITKATKTIESWITAELDKFHRLISEAKAAWQKKELTQLAGLLAEAAAIHTAEQARLDHYHALAADWSAVSAALQRANTALIENNPAEEKKALQELSKLQHDIAELDDRLATVSRRFHQQRVDYFLSQIAQALTTGDVGTARTNLNSLQSFDSNTFEIPKLTADIEQLEEKIAFETAMRAMDQFAADDNWADALEVANSYHQQFQNYLRFQQRADFIGQVHGLINSASNILDAPDQLIRSSAQKTAATLITNANTALSFSPTLARLTTALEEMLINYTTPLEIIVLSDSQTFVEVKSIGQVGAVTQKTIQLLPGDYIFVGKRKGYFTIQLPVVLRPGDSGIKISVIANEQI